VQIERVHSGPHILWKSTRSRRHIGVSRFMPAQFPCRQPGRSPFSSFLPAGTRLCRFISGSSPPGASAPGAGGSMCFLLNHPGRRLSLFPTPPMTRQTLSPDYGFLVPPELAC
jgi:hypothetical protein